jgi:EKC/KEOPS complex subunit CGI121/TPRKB
MQEYVFEPDGSRLHVALFRHVRNGASLAKQLAGGGVEAALINARLVPSLLVVRVAAWKALCDARQGAMTTRNVHSELMFDLSPDNAISRSLKAFGVSDTTDCVLVCVLNGTSSQRDAALGLVEGERVDPSTSLAELCNVAAVCELYQVTEDEMQVMSLQDAVVNRISAKISKKAGLV